MTNLQNGVVIDGTKLTTATNYKVNLDVTNATPLQVTGGASVSGATTTGTLRVGTTGDTISAIKTYTSSAINVAAINIAAAKEQKLDLTVTGVLTTDQIISVTPTNAVAGQFVVGNVITAANNVSILLYAPANTNAAAAQTFAVKVAR